jgi:hypothetical protein
MSILSVPGIGGVYHNVRIVLRGHSQALMAHTTGS